MSDGPDDDLWVVPLHGASVPLPPTADVRPAPASDAPPAPVSDGANAEPIFSLFPHPDELPTDVGYHPRLRRSA